MLGSVSTIMDAELMLIVELGEDRVKGFDYWRQVLRKYGFLVIAAAETKQKVKGCSHREKNGKVYWFVFSNTKEP